jgi:hypothetical protein
VPELSADVLRELYATPPDEFLAKRAALAEQAPDADTAKAIQRLRKPTAGAWIVNALVVADPPAVESLTELGEQLRAAQDALDADRLRELTAQRRDVVGRLTNDAFKRAGRRQPPAALRDEVSGTFDAAVADPEVAARLGTLQRAEHWSGFGFAAAGPPDLKLVRGGKDERGKPTAKPQPKSTPAQRRQQKRTLEKARDAFADADAALEDARGTEQELTDRIRALTKKLGALQRELDDARGELETARKDVTAARTRRREARSALDRAERAAE